MTNNVVQMLPFKVLVSIEFIEALAGTLRELNLSRRKTTDWLADVLLAWLNTGRTILDWDGNPVDIDDDLIDLIYGDDASCTSPSTIKRILSGSRRRRSRSTMARRLGLYYVAFVISGQPISIGE